MLQLRHNGEPKASGSRAAVTLHVSDLPHLMESDEYVHPDNRQYWQEIKDRDCKGSYGGFKEWFGGLTSIREALSLIYDGWASGAQRATAASDGIPNDQLARPESVRRRIVWGEEGDRLDWQKALDGDHDTCWGRSKRRRTSAPRMISLASTYGGNCHRSAEELFWSGAQMVVVAELLLGAGYQIEIRGVAGNDGGSSYDPNRMGIIDITAKGYDEPLRLDMLAAVFSHAGVFRTYGFQAYMRLPWDVGYGYGHAVDDASKMKKAIDDMAALGWLAPVDVFVPAAFSQASAIKNIVAAIQAVEAKQSGRAA